MAHSDQMEKNTSLKNHGNKLLYSIDEVPPIITSIALGFQQMLTMFGGTVAAPLVLKSILNIEGEESIYVTQLMGTILVISGISTFLQVTFGIKLPIVQGGSFAFIAAVAAIVGKNKGSLNVELSNNTEWRENILEVQGCLIAGSILQIIIGITGIAGFLTKCIGPLTICPCITLIGISLFKVCISKAKYNWPLTLFTSLSIIFISQCLSKFRVPFTKKRLYVFELFPVFIAIVTAWFVAFMCTTLNIFSEDPSDLSYGARTDINLQLVYNSHWFSIPYPFQWGLPNISLSGTIGMSVAIIASVFESIGDYAACARLCQKPFPKKRDINRGIFMEGLGCLLAGIFGSGIGTTSYSENIGVIGITKVASRRVVQISAVLMLILGCCNKLASIFTIIPDPIVGGVFFCMFGMITAVGLASLQTVNLNSTRNLFVLGYSLIMGISLPHFFETSETSIFSNPYIDEIVNSLLVNGMFVGALIGFLLDNALPGSKKDRGFQVPDCDEISLNEEINLSQE